jgi:hypothetical protein
MVKRSRCLALGLHATIRYKELRCNKKAVLFYWNVDNFWACQETSYFYGMSIILFAKDPHWTLPRTSSVQCTTSKPISSETIYVPTSATDHLRGERDKYEKMSTKQSVTLPVTVAERSKAWTVFARSDAGRVGSNLTSGMAVLCVCVCVCVCTLILCLCCIVYR